MESHIPYTYLIGWSELNKYYYGRRTAKNCNPSELWKTYFTSSRLVKQFRLDNGEPDIIQVRRTFTDKKKCSLWECKFLERINAQHNSKFLNQRNGDYRWDRTGISNAGIKHPMYGKPGLSGIDNPMYGVVGVEHPMYGRKGKDHPAYGRLGKDHYLSKNYIATSPTGEVYIFTGINMFCRQHNLNQAHMIKVAKGIYKQHKGWTCKYNKEELC